MAHRKDIKEVLVGIPKEYHKKIIKALTIEHKRGYSEAIADLKNLIGTIPDGEYFGHLELLDPDDFSGYGG